MKKIIIAIFLFFLLTACSRGIIPTVTPAGEPAYVIKCSTTQEDCYAKAGKACPNGYHIVDEPSVFMIICK